MFEGLGRFGIFLFFGLHHAQQRIAFGAGWILLQFLFDQALRFGKLPLANQFLRVSEKG